MRGLEIVGGRYRIVRELAIGGMGTIYEAEHVGTRDRFALKLMTVGEDDPQLVTRFRREASAAAKIASDHVVRVFEVDVADDVDGRLFIVMELLDGNDLAQLLTQRGPLPPGEALAYLQHVADAVASAHSVGIVHRDLKPQNLFLHRRPDGTSIVKLLDFGVARMMDPDVTDITDACAPIGTPRYMAPEQLSLGGRGIGPATDVWALGLVALELLTTESYWRAHVPSALMEEIRRGAEYLPSARWPFLPRRFDTWFLRSCAIEPRDRWRSVREQIDALTPVLEHAAARATSDRGRNA